MAKIKIEVLEAGKPAATIIIPLWLAHGASKILSRTSGKKLRNKIDFDAILKAAGDPEAHGVILQVEDHEDGDKVTISIIGNGAA
jgi:hypothetical protein